MVSSAQVLELVKLKGPIIPSDINSELKTDTFMIGALLSELIGANKIKISHAKIGGSKVYYIEEQRPKLERLYEYLNQKDKRAYDLLKKDIVVLDETLDPLFKTCMRELKDFANPVKVNYKNQILLFWKWHLGTEAEVKTKIRSILAEIFPKEKKEEPNKIEEVVEKITEKEVQKEELKIEPVKEIKPEKIRIEKIKDKPKEEEDTTLDVIQEPVEIKDTFLDELREYFDKIKIIIKEFEIVKKKTEIDLIIELPSAIGNLTYYCKAKNKKRSNEGDIASAYLEGQLRSLPPAYLSKGDVPKKVEPLLQTKFKGIKMLKWELQ